jgi:hypothetical protein
MPVVEIPRRRPDAKKKVPPVVRPDMIDKPENLEPFILEKWLAIKDILRIPEKPTEPQA